MAESSDCQKLLPLKSSCRCPSLKLYFESYCSQGVHAPRLNSKGRYYELSRGPSDHGATVNWTLKNTWADAMNSPGDHGATVNWTLKTWAPFKYIYTHNSALENLWCATAVHHL